MIYKHTITHGLHDNNMKGYLSALVPNPDVYS